MRPIQNTHALIGVVCLVLLCTPVLTACGSGLAAALNPATVTFTPLPPTETWTPEPTATLTKTPLPTATETAVPTATQTSPPTQTPTPESHRMDALVEKLYADGVIHSTAGVYTSLGDFDQEWAQLNWYQWYPMGVTPENFILRLDAAWESASKTANWADSGCGVVFSEKDEDNHHAVFLNMDGYVRTHKFMNGWWYDQQGGYYGPFSTPADHAEFVLVVENQVLTVFVNGKQVVQYEDAYIRRGNLGLSLASGSNLDFGTRCEMRDIDYWVIR